MKNKSHADKPLLRLLESIANDPPKTAISRLKNIRRILKRQLRRIRKKRGIAWFPDTLSRIRRQITPAEAHLFPPTWGQLSAPASTVSDSSASVPGVSVPTVSVPTASDSRRVKVVRASDASGSAPSTEFSIPPPPSPNVIREVNIDTGQRRIWDVLATTPQESDAADDEGLLFVTASGIKENGGGSTPASEDDSAPASEGDGVSEPPENGD